MMVKDFIKAFAQRVAKEDCPSFLGLKGQECEYMNENCVACWEQALTRIATEEGIGLTTKDPKGLRESTLKEEAKHMLEGIVGRSLTSDEFAIFSMTYGMAMFDAYSLWKDQLGEEVGNIVVWTNGKTVRKYVGQDTYYEKQAEKGKKGMFLSNGAKTPEKGYYRARAILYREG